MSSIINIPTELNPPTINLIHINTNINDDNNNNNNNNNNNTNTNLPTESNQSPNRPPNTWSTGQFDQIISTELPTNMYSLILIYFNLRFI